MGDWRSGARITMDRGLEVLSMLQSGATNKAIAATLHCSMSTINHVRREAELTGRRSESRKRQTQRVRAVAR
jgi:DNA-binding NarL/FixJ family response regulator